MESKSETVADVDLSSIIPPPYWTTLTEVDFYISVILQFNLISQKEFKLIEEFKELVKEHILPFHTDYYFSRFLVARKWDLKLSSELFINAMKVRVKEDMDNILETFPNNFWYYLNPNKLTN